MENARRLIDSALQVFPDTMTVKGNIFLGGNKITKCNGSGLRALWR